MCKARCITHQGKVISATGMHNHAPHMNNKSQDLPPGHSPNSLLSEFFGNPSVETAHPIQSMPNFQFLQHPVNQNQASAMIQNMPSVQNLHSRSSAQLPLSQNECISNAAPPTIAFKHENL